MATRWTICQPAWVRNGWDTSPSPIAATWLPKSGPNSSWVNQPRSPPSDEALRTRLVGRGSDAPEQIERRLEVAREELAAEGEFDHVVVNDDLDAAAEELSKRVATITSP